MKEQQYTKRYGKSPNEIYNMVCGVSEESTATNMRELLNEHGVEVIGLLDDAKAYFEKTEEFEKCEDIKNLIISLEISLG